MVKSKEKLTKLAGDISAMLTLVDTFPDWETSPYSKTLLDWLENGGSFTQVFDILQLLFILIGADKWEEWLMSVLSKTFVSNKGIERIEAIIKDALIVAMQGFLSCQANPIIPDILIDGGKGGPKATAGKGYTFPLSTLDIVGKLYTSPSTIEGKYLYFDICNKITNFDEVTSASTTTYVVNVAEMWKSRDFDAFLFYVINKASSTGGDLYKCIWDNRYTPMEEENWDIGEHLYGNSDAFYNALTPDEVNDYNKSANAKSGNVLAKYKATNNAGGKKKKKQIARLEYLEGNSLGDGAIRVLINDSNYYQKYNPNIKISGTTLALNAFMLEWDYDYIQSIKLLNPTVVLAQLIDILFNSSLRVSVSLNRSKLVVNQLVDQIVENIISIDDTQINDCYFSFSNDEYDSLMQRADLVRRGLMSATQEIDTTSILESLDTVSDSATKNVGYQTLSRIISSCSKSVTTSGGTSDGKTTIEVSSLLGSILKKVAYPFIECLLTPKVMLLFAINMTYIGKDMTSNWNDVLSIIMNVVKKIIVQIKDIIIEAIFAYIMEKIYDLVEKVLVLRLQEQIRRYRAILERLVSLFQGCGNTGIANVNYAEITTTSTDVDNDSC